MFARTLGPRLRGAGQFILFHSRCAKERRVVAGDVYRNRLPLIIQRYLAREILQSFAAVLAILLLVFAAHRFVRFLTEASSGRIPSDVIFQLVVVKLTVNLTVLLPLAFFIGVLLALGRLHKDSEVVAMSAGGVGLRSLAHVVLGLSLGFALLIGLMSCYASPRLAAIEDSILTRARGEAEVTGLAPGHFKEFGQGNIVYVESIEPDRRTLRGVFVRVTRGDREELVVAERAYQSIQGREGERFMVLEDGHRYSGVPGRRDFVITRFARHAVRLDVVTRPGGRRNLDSIPTMELWRSEKPEHAAELQWRASLPISAVLLALLALPLARTTPRQGRYGKLFLAVVVYFVYNNGLGIAQSLIERGELRPAVGVWPVHVLMAAFVGAMIFAQSSGGWRLGRRLRELRARP